MSNQRIQRKQKQLVARISLHQPKVSVIIPVCNEARTLAKVIREAFRVHPQTEVIVVDNGSSDGSKRVAAQLGARVISFNQPLGHDVGRSIGAKEARGDILLFLDADFVVAAKEVMPLVRAVQRGVDVALNKYNGSTAKVGVHRVVLAKHALNAIINRPDLLGASMTTIPHAISRKALNMIGADNLAVPPLAQAIAAHHGLHIKATQLIQVGLRNRIRRRPKASDPIGDLIIGDHLEAIGWLVGVSGERASIHDQLRVREMMR
ncbi:hypothetical protein GCM10008018_59440 [Paenibacillus marchantiophytorum]|uniref:4,4'-diaponeurosporenoate glycosyltransferase n=1 Tax=Paenibacillus marchantiophytorum TaxID=1619310 RepID=A0ABQ1FC06_9BACL|nr:glycosyltransferase family 2 protein [Paenibacillus marchantiophytorum]GGA05546.1 hypothetical protein GCM10008018_59440 [Paenibacillus marchantiophytorum]